MIEPARDAVVLQPARPGIAGEALRRRLDRRHFLVAVAVALLFHILIVLGFWLVDLLKVRDIGEWSGPVLVKIGAPDALVSPLPDLAPLVEETETPLEEPPSEAVPEPITPETEDTKPSTPSDPQTSPDSNKPSEETQVAESAVSEAIPAPAPVPSRVQGSEEGNNYLMDFEGTEGEVGRAGAYEYITSYMPLPEVIPAALIQGITGTKTMPPDSILGEIEKYWEPVFGDYSKKAGISGVPFPDRPYYWSLLENYLNYDIADADWKTAGMRPVVVEFLVSPSEGAKGAELSGFVMKIQTNNPRVNEAVIYGLSRWVYYNNTDKPIKGRITYRFDR